MQKHLGLLGGAALALAACNGGGDSLVTDTDASTGNDSSSTAADASASDTLTTSATGDPAVSNAVAYGLALAGQDLDRADVLVDAALADEPDNVNYLDTKGWIACRRGDAAAGLALLERARDGAEIPVQEIEDHLVDCPAAGPSTP